jgi:serine protease AprX
MPAMNPFNFAPPYFKPILVCIAISCSTGISINAQQLAERKTVSSQYSSTELEQLRARFQQQANDKAARVEAWLAADPTRQLNQTTKSQTLTVVDIDKNGDPVFQVSRDAYQSRDIQIRNLASGQLIKAHSLYPGGSIGVNITGTGMVAGVWEPGVPRVTHELIAGKSTIQAGQAGSGQSDHATHVTGTMVGSDLASHPAARGIAYGATAKNWDAFSDSAEMALFASDGFLVSNHSYGDANTQTANLWKYGAYDTEARDWDALTKAAPYYLPFIAIGNEQQSSGNSAKAGYDIVTGSAAAKNVMVVGSVNADKSMSSYSNWGPTDDGRVKPEIVAKGTGIDSAQATSDTAYSGNGEDSSGTSYAAPSAAAAGLLLQQYFKNVSGSFMRSSTLKALMLGTAEDLGRTGPDHQFGWGLLNVENAALAIKKQATNPAAGTGSFAYPQIASRGAVIDEITVNPANDSVSEISRSFFAKGDVPLVVNIAWIDDEGNEQVSGEGIDPDTPRLVFDFDILVRTTAGGTIDARPWKVPSMANRTADATTSTTWFDDNRNNFRQVVITNPVAGAQYEVFIRKSSNSPASVKVISLIVTGLVESEVPASQTIGSISFSSTTLTTSSPVTVSATASSGLPIAFSSATQSICTINGSTVTGIAPGTCTIAANQAGNASFLAAPQVTANITVTAANPTRLLNIATRGKVETVDNVMIAGFIIQGSSAKKVLIRARGPSLAVAPFNVPGTLADPFLTLYSGATPIDTNDDFAQHANAAQIPADWTPANAKEAAIVTTLSPGAYTAIVNGVSSTSGVAIVEVFELDQPGTPLINIATRGPVQTGDNVMIAGLIIQGDAPKTVLITARGPSMAGPPHNVPGTLSDPVLTLFSGQTPIASNDNWPQAANAAQIQTAIGAPSNTLESAILITLQPGAYTAIVNGASNATGLGIVEVFAQ